MKKENVRLIGKNAAIVGETGSVLDVTFGENNGTFTVQGERQNWSRMQCCKRCERSERDEKVISVSGYVEFNSINCWVEEVDYYG